MKNLTLTLNDTVPIARSEIELILCCARTKLDPQTNCKIEQLLLQKFDWNYLIELASYHKVLPLLTQNLLLARSKAIPPQVLTKLQQIFHAQGRHNMALTNRLLKFTQLFKQHDIPVVFFKGPVFAASAYGNILLRQNDDLDLLVKNEDFLKASQLLLSLGYKRTVQIPWETHFSIDDGLNVDLDLHRQIIPQHLSCSLNSDYVWSRISWLSLTGTTVSTISPEANLLILCLNGNKECWQHLNRVCDLAELIRANPNLDWQQIISDAEAMGFVRVISLGLLLAHNLLETELPKHIVSWIYADPIATDLFKQINLQLFSEARSIAPETLETALFHIKTRERWQDKIWSLAALMMLAGWLQSSKKDRNAPPIPKVIFILYYLFRPIRVSLRYGKILLKKQSYYI